MSQLQHSWLISLKTRAPFISVAKQFCRKPLGNARRHTMAKLPFTLGAPQTFERCKHYRLINPW